MVIVSDEGIVTNYNIAPGAYGSMLLGRLGLVKNRLETAINKEEENASNG